MFAPQSHFVRWRVLLVVAFAIGSGVGRAEDASTLRLVPFPKEVELKAGTFTLDGELTLEAPATSAQLLGSSINDELRTGGFGEGED